MTKTVALITSNTNLDSVKSRFIKNIGQTLVKNYEQKVLLVDCNLRNNLSNMYLSEKERMSLKKTLSEVLFRGSLVNEVIIPISKGLDIVPANKDLILIENLFTSLNVSVYTEILLHVFADVIESEKYNYILIDCPSGITNLTKDSLTIADEVLIVAKQKQVPPNSFTGMEKLVDDVKRNSNHKLNNRGAVIIDYFDNLDYKSSFMSGLKEREPLIKLSIEELDNKENYRDEVVFACFPDISDKGVK